MRSFGPTNSNLPLCCILQECAIAQLVQANVNTEVRGHQRGRNKRLQRLNCKRPGFVQYSTVPAVGANLRDHGRYSFRAPWVISSGQPCCRVLSRAHSRNPLVLRTLYHCPLFQPPESMRMLCNHHNSARRAYSTTFPVDLLSCVHLPISDVYRARQF
jgi:hypothetical protein